MFSLNVLLSSHIFFSIFNISSIKDRTIGIMTIFVLEQINWVLYFFILALLNQKAGSTMNLHKTISELNQLMQVIYPIRLLYI